MNIRDPIETMIQLDCPGEWAAALDGIPHSFTHTWEHCYAMHLTTGYPTYLYSLRSGQLRIVCPIAERPAGKFIEAVTPWGFSGFAGTGDIPEFPSIWESFVRSRGYVTAFITLNPLFYRPSFTEQSITCDHRTLYFVDLASSEEDIFNNFSASRRRELRRWHESGVSIVCDREALTLFFLEHYQKFFCENNFPKAYFFTQKSFAYLLGLSQVYAVGASTGSGVDAMLLCWHTPFSAECIFSVRAPERRKHLAGLTWTAAKHFRSLRVPVLSLGGGFEPDDNITTFKRRFHAISMPFRALRQIIRPAVFDELCRETGCSNETTGYFPPYQTHLGESIHVQ